MTLRDTQQEIVERPVGPAADWRMGLSRMFLAKLMARLARGRLTVVTPDGAVLVQQAPESGPDAVIVLKRWRAIRRLVLQSDIGFARAYCDGDFNSPDMTAVMELAAVNDHTLRALISGSWPARLLNRALHLGRANTRRGSARNITAHYDLGNAFYAQWLDESMTYSSALYTQPGQTLEQAQEAKLDLIVERLHLKGGERVLEIGCGWGALAERLAREGCHVTGITLSPSQLGYAQNRIAEAGLSNKVDLRLQDYRAVTGQFDRIVSIEMIEAVGREFWPSYFATLRNCLKPDGRIVLQAITIEDSRFASYASGADFIQHYIFPGGLLPSPTAMREQIAAAGLSLAELFSFGDSYALTLQEWRVRFLNQWQSIGPLGFDEPFRRMWEFYLCYCEGGFRSAATDVGLFAITMNSTSAEPVAA
ncbi:cyclopropane-fatty-acyl-phospholipid synthase family protein [soil metagenome]